MAVDATRFAIEWQAAWNARDLSRILSHYTEDVIFRSRKAMALVGAGELRGKPALRHYWQRALANQPDLHFTVKDVFAGHQMMVVIYENQRGTLAAETLMFTADGLIWQASACHADIA
ncbi:MAG: nuclear transport factor 2 family protein [Pseudomonadota bacterium]